MPPKSHPAWQVQEVLGRHRPHQYTGRKAASKATSAKSKPLAVSQDKSIPSLNALPIIDAVPKKAMTIFVFGTGDSSSEHGLGPGVKEARRATVIPALDLCEDGIDGGHLGLNLSQEQIGDPKLVRRYEFGRPRVILKPLTVPHIGDAIHVACSTGHTTFVNSEGKAFASGFGFQYQLGNGMTDDIETTTEVKAKALKNVGLSWFCAAGQYSMVEAPVAETCVMGSNSTIDDF